MRDEREIIEEIKQEHLNLARTTTKAGIDYTRNRLQRLMDEINSRGKRRRSTILYLDNPEDGINAISLLEARFRALEDLGEGYISDRDKKNGYSVDQLKRMTLCQISSMILQRMLLIKEVGISALSDKELDEWESHDDLWHDLNQKMENINKEIKKMDAEQNQSPSYGENVITETPSGGDEKLKKRFGLIIELREAQKTLEAQYKQTQTIYKSKMGALRKSEDHLLESVDENQMSLFDADPEISEEARKVIENPII